MAHDESEVLTQTTSPSHSGNNLRMRVGAVLAIVIALGFVVWIALAGGGGGAGSSTASPQATTSPMAATIVTAQELADVPDRVGHPVYWAGEIGKKDLELTILADGTVYVRYVPDGVPAGVDKPAFLTVATYQRADAYSLVERGANLPGAVRVQNSGGALVSAESEESTSAFFAFEGVPLLVEVFDPKPGRAFEEIQSGRVQMVQ